MLGYFFAPHGVEDKKKKEHQLPVVKAPPRIATPSIRIGVPNSDELDVSRGLIGLEKKGPFPEKPSLGGFCRKSGSFCKS